MSARWVGLRGTLGFEKQNMDNMSRGRCFFADFASCIQSECGLVHVLPCTCVPLHSLCTVQCQRGHHRLPHDVGGDGAPGRIVKLAVESVKSLPATDGMF
jgi:hypothetical protein